MLQRVGHLAASEMMGRITVTDSCKEEIFAKKTLSRWWKYEKKLFTPKIKEHKWTDSNFLEEKANVLEGRKRL